MVTKSGAIPAVRRPYSAEDKVQIVRGVTDIDDSAQTETTPFVVLTVAAPANAPLREVAVIFDMDVATTGWGTLETTASIQFAVARLVDGTNWRIEVFVPPTALTGTLAAADRAINVPVGDIPAGAAVRIYCMTSADVTADTELPYQVLYKGPSAPTITEVAAV